LSWRPGIVCGFGLREQRDHHDDLLPRPDRDVSSVLADLFLQDVAMVELEEAPEQVDP
jgi:hypothetical protein